MSFLYYTLFGLKFIISKLQYYFYTILISMPLKRGHDSRGKYYQWGNSNKKYYYDSESDRKDAKHKAIVQGYAIEKSQERQGKPNKLQRSGTGKKTNLNISRSKTNRKSGSKSNRRSGSKSNRRSGSKPNRRSSSKTNRRPGSKSNRRPSSKTKRRSGSKSNRRSGSKANRRSESKIKR